MNHLLPSIGLGLSLVFAASLAVAQTTADRAHPIYDIELSDVEAPPLPELETAPFATRTLTYEDGMELLRQNNLQVEIARQSLEDAAIIDSQARSIFVPTINLTAQVVYNNREVRFAQGNMFAPFTPYLDSVYNNDPALQNYFANNPDAVDARQLANAPAEEMIVRPRTDFSAQVTLTQPLFTARIFPARKLARIVKEQANAGIEVAAQQSLVAYNQLFFQAVALRRFISVATQNVENAELTLNRARILFEEQAGTEFDLTRAEVSHRAAVRDLTNARTSYRLSIEAIATLMRVEPNFDVVSPEELEAPASVDDVLSVALQERADLHAASLNIARSDAMAQEANMRKYPTLLGQAQASVGRVTVFTDQAVNWSLSLIASWDIFDGGAAGRDRRSARVEQARASLQLDLQRDQIRDEIRRSWIEFQNQENLISQAEAEVAFATQNYQLTIDARDLGAASALDVDMAQNQLYQAQLAYADAKTSQLAAIYNLYILQGTSSAITSSVR